MARKLHTPADDQLGHGRLISGILGFIDLISSRCFCPIEMTVALPGTLIIDRDQTLNLHSLVSLMK